MPNISPDSKPIHYVCLLDALPQCDLPIFYPAAAILDCWKRMVFWTGQQFTIWICESSKQLVTKDGLSCFAPTLWKSLSTTWAYQHTVTLLIFLVKQEQGKWFTKKQNRIHEPQCRNGNYVKTATQLLSATPATLLLYLLDWHASKVLHLPRKTQEWPPSAKAWSGKKTFRAKLPPVLTVPSWKSTISFVLYWLLRSFLHFFKMLPLPRLLTLCRAGGRKNANATSTHVTKRNQKHAICEEIDVQHIRRITCLSQFASAAQRWGLATSLRVTLPGCGRSSNPGRTWLQPPDIPRLCPKQLPGCLGRITAGCLVLYSEVGVWNRTCRKWKSTYWLLFWDPYHGLS